MMLTVCPKCTLTLVVTASDLRIGQGYVRCGRCTTVFNALLSLAEESGDEAPGVTTTSVAAVPHTTEAQPKEFSGTETMETIVLEGDGVMQTEEFVDIATINREIADATRQQFAAAADAPLEVAPDPEDLPPPEHWLHDEADHEARADADEVDEASPEALTAMLEPPAAMPRPNLWLVAAALLLLLASAQLLHHWRNELALSPGWFRLLNRPYLALGMPLNPQWDLQGYDLQQLGGGVDDQRHQLRIQLSVASRGQAELPFPVLRLALYNRFGRRLLTRALQAGDYLPTALRSGGFMTPTQRYASEFGVADIAADVSSFELDVCLPAEHGLRCASDQPHT